MHGRFWEHFNDENRSLRSFDVDEKTTWYCHTCTYICTHTPTAYKCKLSGPSSIAGGPQKHINAIIFTVNFVEIFFQGPHWLDSKFKGPFLHQVLSNECVRTTSQTHTHPHIFKSKDKSEYWCTTSLFHFISVSNIHFFHMVKLYLPVFTITFYYFGNFHEHDE